MKRNFTVELVEAKGRVCQVCGLTKEGWGMLITLSMLDKIDADLLPIIESIPQCFICKECLSLQAEKIKDLQSEK